MTNELEEIKQKLSLVDLVSTYIEVKKAGRNYRALCPFHTDQSPSLMISPEKQIWHCFGCHEGGDQFGFVMKIEGIDFGQALRSLAEKAGVKLQKDVLGRASENSKKKEKLFSINEDAAKLFHYILTTHPAGKPALGYLKDRSLTDKNIKDFQLGFAPEKFDLLIKFFGKKDIGPADLASAGLTVAKSFAGSSSSKYMDKFRSRIMFPITDTMGDIVGFTGRLLGDKKDAPKYLNTPDTLIFDKSSVLYGLDKAKRAIRDKGRVIVVEGNIDVIASQSAGYTETVATSGTALTARQFELLARYTTNIILAFDNDSAGVLATKRAAGTALGMGMEVGMAAYSQAKDPDELILEDKKLWEKALSEPLNLIEFSLYHHKKSGKLTTQHKQEITKELLPILKTLDDAILRGEYIQKLSDTLGIDMKYLEEALAKTSVPRTSSNDKPKVGLVEQSVDNTGSLIEKDQLTDQEIFERKISGMSIVYYDHLGKLRDKLTPEMFSNSFARDIVHAQKRFIEARKKFLLEDFLSKLPASFRSKLDYLILSVEGEFVNLEEEAISAEFVLLLNKLKKYQTGQLTNDFALAIKSAEQDGDIGRVKSLLKELQDKLEA
jgi:DNA primase